MDFVDDERANSRRGVRCAGPVAKLPHIHWIVDTESRAAQWNEIDCAARRVTADGNILLGSWKRGTFDVAEQRSVRRGRAQIHRLPKFTQREGDERIADVKVSLIENFEPARTNHRVVWKAEFFQSVGTGGISAHEVVA